MSEHRNSGEGQVWPKHHCNERWVRVLVTCVLTIQVTIMVITLRYSKISTRYLNSTAVLLAEGLKTTICTIVLAWQYGPHLGEHLQQNFAGKPRDLVLVSVPALLYLLQNNLLFYAMEHLEAVVYQVTYQLKILTTAVCMVLMMGKQLSGQQWLSLLLLAWGIALAQYQASEVAVADAGAATTSSASRLSGFAALVVACFISGFAGVYTEKLLKQTTASLWLRNIQLGVWSLLLGTSATFYADGQQIREGGFFQGYTFTVWCVVLLQAASGILVALVMKLADNIVKNFSAAISLLLSTLVSIPIFNFQLTGHFVVGACMVLLSVHLYSGGSVPRCGLLLHCQLNDKGEKAVPSLAV